MMTELYQTQEKTIQDDPKTLKRIELALKQSRKMDQTEQMDLAAKNFNYLDAAHSLWNPEKFSLLYGTWLWDQSSPEQRRILNQLYWVAYYSQITSAEIATIFFNQTCAASLYGIEDFRAVCDTLDMESAQERAHINAFKKVSEEFELKLFGERVFTYPMRTPFVKTMMYSDLNAFQQWWRKIQLNAFTLLSANYAFIGCQYFTVRGLRTLNGKIVQHQLSRFYTDAIDREATPIPSKISYYHFIDESFHFNTSTVVGHDVVNSLKAPTAFEARVANMGLWGCQKDHFNFSTAINGIFWYDPALYANIFKVLKSPVFGMNKTEALEAMEKSFCTESEGALESQKTHALACESYKSYLADFKYVNRANKEMRLMSQNNLERHLRQNRRGLAQFARSL